MSEGGAWRHIARRVLIDADAGAEDASLHEKGSLNGGEGAAHKVGDCREHIQVKKDDDEPEEGQRIEPIKRKSKGHLQQPIKSTLRIHCGLLNAALTQSRLSGSRRSNPFAPGAATISMKVGSSTLA